MHVRFLLPTKTNSMTTIDTGHNFDATRAAYTHRHIFMYVNDKQVLEKMIYTIEHTLMCSFNKCTVEIHAKSS